MDEISFFLKEDLQNIGDITSESLFRNETAEGVITVNEDCMLAGLNEAGQVFSHTGALFNPLKKDGDIINKSESIAIIKGSLCSILSGERLALNFLGRMSGIATETKKIIDICKPINPTIEIASTRKTTPGFRKYEKKAVVIAGGVMHRMGLYDAILIKDNHLKVLKSVEKAITLIRNQKPEYPIEIEVETEKDALKAAQLSVNVIMLDNFSAQKAEEIVKKIKQINPSIFVELSGRITKENIMNYAKFADRISLGILTHTIKNIDFSLEIQ